MPTGPSPTPDAPPDHPVALRVLASSSSGNCTLLRMIEGDRSRLVLIDLGLSPRRTRRALAEAGLAGVPIDAILMTHFDDDHFHSGWAARVPEGATLHLHRRHRGRAERAGALASRASLFDDPFELFPGVVVSPVLAPHDDQGSAAFRIDVGAGSIGFLTDAGRATARIVEHLAGVHLLAIESNYCPHLQRASPRPEYLKRRIMDGAGHLSNEQCAEAARAIAPREHVVLLHLSRECNRPELAASYHEGRPYTLTVAHPEAPTPWISPTPTPGGPGPSAPSVVMRPASVQKLLFG